MDQESLSKMFTLANSSLSTLNYQINSLNYNPTLNQFDKLQHFLSFFKQRINSFETEFKNKALKLSKKKSKIPANSISSPSRPLPIPRIKSSSITPSIPYQNLLKFQQNLQEKLPPSNLINASKPHKHLQSKSRPISGLTRKPNILPENLRNNPFSDLPTLSKADLNRGFFSLVNQGILPKDVDLTPGMLKPGFFRLRSARIHDKNIKTAFLKPQKIENFFLTEKEITKKILKNEEFSFDKKIIDGIVKIQKFWRFLSRRNKKRRKNYLVIKIQRIIRRILNRKRLKEKIEVEKGIIMKKYKKMQSKFKEKWDLERKHVEIIINTTKDQEALYLLRLFELKDQNLTIIYISTNEISSDIKAYYYKILELYGIKTYESRIHFLIIQDFPNLSPTLSLYYSTKTLQTIKSLIQASCPYIITPSFDPDLFKVASFLRVPSINGDLITQKNLLSMEKTNEILMKSGLPTPPSSQILTNKENLLVSFVRLILNNLSIDKWGFFIHKKTQKELLAYFDLQDFKGIRNILTNNSLSFEQKANILLKSLSDAIPEKLHFFSKTITSEEFLADFFLFQGSIVAYPPNFNLFLHTLLSLVIFIDPLGETTLICSYETPMLNEIPFGFIFPQNSLGLLNIELIGRNIAKNLYKEDIYGFITVELVVFEGKNMRESLFWTRDLKFGLSEFISIFSLFCCLMRDGEFDPFNKKFLLGKDETLSGDNQKKRLERGFLFIPDSIKTNDGIHLKGFFDFCKGNEICFDYEKRMGPVFVLHEKMQEIGIILIEEKKEIILKKMMGNLVFLKKKFPSKKLEILIEKLKRIIMK